MVGKGGFMFLWQKRVFRSQLFTEKDFYTQFILDLQECKNEVIIESPYITTSRMEWLYPVFRELLTRRVKVHIITRDPIEHDGHFRHQATNEILKCNEMGINLIMLKGNHHRKLAIIDRKILWEGSLNILSYNHSQEIMRRIDGKEIANQMYHFLKLDRYLNIQ